MLNKVEAYYLKLQEPHRGCLLALRHVIKSFDELNITEEWKYGLPSFYYKKKPFCYFWKDPKTQVPYIGISKGYLIEHPFLIKGNRTRIKIIPVALEEDIPVKIIYEIFELTLKFYK